MNKSIYTYIYTNMDENNIDFMLIKDKFKKYIIDSYDWDVDGLETIDTLFDDNVLNWNDYIFINKSNTAINIDNDGLIEEIDKICSDFMAGNDILRLFSIMGIDEEIPYRSED